MSGRPSGRSSIDQEYGSSDSEDSIPGSPDLFPVGSEVSSWCAVCLGLLASFSAYWNAV